MAQELDIGAQVVPARATHGAVPAGDSRLNGDLVSHLKARYAVGDVDNFPGGLMSENVGGGYDNVADAAVRVVVHVGAAHADRAHANEKLALDRDGVRQVLDSKIATAMQNGCSHTVLRAFGRQKRGNCTPMGRALQGETASAALRKGPGATIMP